MLKEHANMWNEATLAQKGGGAPASDGSALRHESALVGAGDVIARHAGSPGAMAAAVRFSVRENAFVDLVNVRGDERDTSFMHAIETIVGCRAPTQPNTVSQGPSYDMIWLGPDEWLVRSHKRVGPSLSAALAGALDVASASAVDVGSGFSVLTLRGTLVREVLARGCPLDLHPREFRTGQCAQSHFFKAGITLVMVADDVFDVIVRRSFADYFVRMLADAADPLV
jgi:sarcosine oxidase, subunit gamma